MFNQPDFLLVTPLLDFLLAPNRHAYVAEDFIVHQPKNPVPFCESGSKARAMLRDTPFQIVRHSRVQVS